VVRIGFFCIPRRIDCLRFEFESNEISGDNMHIIKIFHSILLIALSIIFLFLFLASGHKPNFEDLTQFKFLLETLIFFASGMLLLPAWQKGLRSYMPIVILLSLVQLSLVDLFFEISTVEHDSSTAILFFFNLLLSTINLILIYSFFKKAKVSGDKSGS
jgi:hypothetical protein